MVTVAQANLGNRSYATVLGGLMELGEHADVININEGGDRWREISEFCSRSRWAFYFDEEQEGSASTPILWKPATVKVAHHGCRPSTPATNCGALGVGPNVVKAKVFNHVRVAPRPTTPGNKKPFVDISGHWPASLWAPCRHRLGEIMVGDLADMVQRRDDHGVDVVATFDGNARARAALWKQLRELGMHQHVDFATKGVRTIDLGWTLNRHAYAEPFRGRFSDHRWVLLHLL